MIYHIQNIFKKTLWIASGIISKLRYPALISKLKNVFPVCYTHIYNITSYRLINKLKISKLLLL